MTDLYHYYYDQYTKDIRHWIQHFKKQPRPHIVGIYRGGLPIATHLSNVLKCPMSIIRFQLRDGDDIKPEWILNNIGISATWKTPGETIIVIEDIYDTGNTMRAIQQMDELKNHPDVIYKALWGSKNDDGVGFLNERISKWIVFPWERSTGGM